MNVYKTNNHSEIATYYKGADGRGKTITIGYYKHYHTNDAGEIAFIENMKDYKNRIIVKSIIEDYGTILSPLSPKVETSTVEVEKVSETPKETPKTEDEQTVNKGNEVTTSKVGIKYLQAKTLQDAAEQLYNNYGVTEVLETEGEIREACAKLNLRLRISKRWDKGTTSNQITIDND